MDNFKKTNNAFVVFVASQEIRNPYVEGSASQCATAYVAVHATAYLTVTSGWSAAAEVRTLSGSRGREESVGERSVQLHWEVLRQDRGFVGAAFGGLAQLHCAGSRVVSAYRSFSASSKPLLFLLLKKQAAEVEK